jgi:hypothetical protein
MLNSFASNAEPKAPNKKAISITELVCSRGDICATSGKFGMNSSRCSPQFRNPEKIDQGLSKANIMVLTNPISKAPINGDHWLLKRLFQISNYDTFCQENLISLEALNVSF